MVTEVDRSTWQNSGSGVDTLLERIAERLGVTVKSSTVFGEPVERDGLTVIPVAKARWGFGGGGGTGQDRHGPGEGGGGGGGGGGMSMTPVGYIEISHGQSTFRPIREARWYLPYALGASALLLLSLSKIGRLESPANGLDWPSQMRAGGAGVLWIPSVFLRADDGLSLAANRLVFVV